MKTRKEKAALLLLCLLQCGILLHGTLLGGHMRLAWWTTLYPQSLYETGIVEADDDAKDEDDDGTEEKKTESVRIKFRLAEWIGSLFAD